MEINRLYRTANIAMTFQPMPGLGEGGEVEIYGNHVAGRIVIRTGTGCVGNTPCRISFPENDFYDTDNLQIKLEGMNGCFVEAQAAGVEGNGFEVYMRNPTTEETAYELQYFIVAVVQ